MPQDPRIKAFRRSGRLGEADADHAAALIAETGEPLDQVLTKLGLLTELEIAAHFAELAGLEMAQGVADLPAPDDDGLDAGLNPAFLRAQRILPVGESDGSVLAALVDPAEGEAADALAFALSRPVRPIVVPASLFERLYARRFAAEPARDEPGQDISADAERLRDMASAAPVIRLVDRLITEAAETRASDIHIEPGAREAVVRRRIDGVLRETGRLAVTQALAAISRIKVLADLDIAEHRRPQDGRMSFPVAGRSIDLRVSVVPTDHGESLVVRLLDPDAGLRDLESLGFSETMTDISRRCLARPNGILLVTGPTGSGKTTTLYAFLRHLADGERKILTIEDPIEYRLAGISQSQVSPAIGLDFAGALRSFLRHDPDVIMVGEIRDEETARTAVQAALTGHLVLSTLHTNDAPGAVTRLNDMGIEPYLVASTLIGAFAQRLVRTICRECAGSGCQACDGTGLAGRMAIAEGFEMDEGLSELVRAEAGEGALREALRRDGFAPMAADGRAKIAAGLTRDEEVERAVGRHD
ncbi:GspE/PulE family protein [Marinicauda salina]|uniref:GspE/PulE family protein n=1 Tax=Marinicauda salina TaxID=2135793 RepID=UPI001E45D087|nr:GspE/PulE family protein [Marinicauda salina]